MNKAGEALIMLADVLDARGLHKFSSEIDELLKLAAANFGVMSEEYDIVSSIKNLYAEMYPLSDDPEKMRERTKDIEGLARRMRQLRLIEYKHPNTTQEMKEWLGEDVLSGVEQLLEEEASRLKINENTLPQPLRMVLEADDALSQQRVALSRQLTSAQPHLGKIKEDLDYYSRVLNDEMFQQFHKQAKENVQILNARQELILKTMDQWRDQMKQIESEQAANARRAQMLLDQMDILVGSNAEMAERIVEEIGGQRNMDRLVGISKNSRSG